MVEGRRKGESKSKRDRNKVNTHRKGDEYRKKIGGKVRIGS